MARRTLPHLVLVLVFAAGGSMCATGDAVAQGARAVYVNRTHLPADTLRMLEEGFQTVVPDGRYWYDAMSGGWGLEGGPTLGFTMAGLPLGGRLPADISGGGTGVFVNGRELHPTDVMGLQQLTGPVAPGRYWLDAQGNAGAEGGPPLVNLRLLAAQQNLTRQGSGVNERYGGGAAAYGNLNTGIGIITDGEGGAAVFGR